MPQPRLDVFLGRKLGLSRQRIRDLLAAGHVRINGQTAILKQKGQPIGPGDDVTLDPAAGDGQPKPQPEPELDFEIIAQAQPNSGGIGWVVINKPAGVPVRPHRDNETGTVINALVAKHPTMVGVGEGGLRSGVVHRLDTDTSGLLIVATQQQAWTTLRACFAQHTTTKRYTALVHGNIPTNTTPPRRGLSPRSPGSTPSEPSRPSELPATQLTHYLTVARRKKRMGPRQRFAHRRRTPMHTHLPSPAQ